MKALNEWYKKTHGSQWAEIYEHPSEFMYAVPFDTRVRDVIREDAELVDEAEASKRGFYFSPLKGRFYKPLHKCQDAEILLAAFAESYRRAPFPVEGAGWGQA